MADSDDEIRPIVKQELPAGETQSAARVASVEAAQLQIDLTLSLNTARDDNQRRRREQDAARRTHLAQDPVAVAVARERDAANRERRRNRLCDTDPEASASAQADHNSSHGAARRRFQAVSSANAAVARAHASAARAESRNRVDIDAISLTCEESENDADTAGMEWIARPHGFCAAEIFTGVGVYAVVPSDFGDMCIVCQKCKAYHWIDQRLESSSDSRPLFSVCCASGTLDRSAFTDPLEPLRS